jgi:hypothetical protein
MAGPLDASDCRELPTPKNRRAAEIVEKLVVVRVRSPARSRVFLCGEAISATLWPTDLNTVVVTAFELANDGELIRH